MSSAIQVINEDQQFNKSILSYIQEKTDNDIGLHYHIISVFGSQSTGKSTLLNSLFGTSFDVMNESKRQQTTKGIWLAYASHIKTTTSSTFSNKDNLLVMDVEGTDGRERGEDQDFERKAALFALSTSEILIINIWEHQVGLYQGANMALLKTVFEVNLSLFGNSRNSKKCLLLFVIRDFIGNTSLESLSQVLIEDLNKIWSQLNKPKNLEDSRISDFFDLRFFPLAHKILKPDEFENGVAKLGDNLVDNSEANKHNYYFKPKYHKQIPFDGWTVYSENVWEQIVANKELDLPTQQILVSRFRCEEIVKNSLEKFEIIFHNLIPDFDNKSLPKSFVSKIRDNIKQLKTDPLEHYDTLASRYTKSVYIEKRKELNDKIDSRLSIVYKLYLKDLQSECNALFISKINELKVNKKNKFLDIVKIAQKQSLEKYQSSLIDEAEEDTSDMKKILDKSLQSFREKELKSIMNKYSKKFNVDLKEKLISLFSSPNENLWKDVMFNFHKSMIQGLQSYETDASGVYDFGIGLSEKQNAIIYSKINNKNWITLHKLIKDYLSEDNVVKIMRDKFEDVFRYNEEGLPIVWKNASEIDAKYKNAKAEALKLLPILSLAQVDTGEVIPELEKTRLTEDGEEEEDEDDEDYEELEELVASHSFAHVLSDTQQNNVKSKFKKQVDILYIDAKRSTIQSITQIPYWIYIVIVVLGWNEFMMILRNPLLITMIALIMVGAYFLQQFKLWGPFLAIVSNTFDEVTRAGKEKLREFVLEDNVLKERSATPPESIELQDLKKNENE